MNDEEVSLAASHIRAGGVAAFPTDTFYGLGADPFNEEAVLSIFEVKGRSADSPVPVLLNNADDLEKVALAPPLEASRLAERFWPGALTLVLKAVERLPDVVSAGAGTVGVRVPDHPVARAIAASVGGAVTGTSANISGEPPMKSATDVRKAFGGALELVVDGECGRHAAASTVVDFTVTPPKVRRQGAISLEELRNVCPEIVE